MSLAPGTRLGAYEVIGPLGQGGMGAVYLARDARLRRDVAIKVLPADLGSDPDRVARFERESQLLAALNHPHIAQVYGLVDLPGERSSGLVMEYVEGGTLAGRLQGGALRVTEALQLARDVADGLDAAHEAGILHRDLKPANIALTPQGKAKILDFGLAKAFPASDQASTSLDATGTGVVLGTPPYMSPEQARGLPLDRRTDIWAFGCVLYEMLTGRQAFGGPSPSDTVAAILERDPDFGLLPAATPPRIRWLVRRCLEKDRTRRLRDIADARVELDEALARPESSSGGMAPVADASRPSGVHRERLLWGLLVVALAAAAAWALFFKAPPATRETAGPLRLDLPLGGDLRLTTPDPAARFAISPDGRRIAFVAAQADGPSMLWVHSLDSMSRQPIAGTEGASYPFWSPDSQHIAYIARPLVAGGLGTQAVLRRVSLAGGRPITLAERAFIARGAWGPGDVILYTPTGNSSLHSVSASAPGAPVPVGTLDASQGDVQHCFPSFLPDGRHFVYTALGSVTAANEARGVYLGSLDGGTPRLLVGDGSHGAYSNGHLFFLRDATLIAQRFDARSFTLVGDPIRIADGLQMTTRASGGTGAFSVSQAGVLLYQTGLGVRSRLAWTDRSGNELSTLGEEGDFTDLAISPDGRRVLVSSLDPVLGTRDLWIYDRERGGRERFTFEPHDDYAPVWGPGGDRVAFTSVRQGTIDIYERRLDASRTERKLESGGSILGKFAAHWSPDGQSLLFIAGGRALARSDIHVASMSGTDPPRVFAESPYVETQVRFSPDGRHVAYMSMESDTPEVYVATFPDGTNRQRVSVGGGRWPRWSRDGREIVFLQPDGAVMAAGVSMGDGTLSLAPPARLFNVRLRPVGRLDAYPYDVTQDGERFLFNMFVEEATSTGLTLVVNWS